jgi:hypothetical protein
MEHDATETSMALTTREPQVLHPSLVLSGGLTTGWASPFSPMAVARPTLRAKTTSGALNDGAAPPSSCSSVAQLASRHAKEVEDTVADGRARLVDGHPLGADFLSRRMTDCDENGDEPVDAAATRANELLEAFELDGERNRQVKTYSGGFW